MACDRKTSPVSMSRKKLVRISTIPLSLNIFCRGLLSELAGEYDTVAITSSGEGFDEIGRREGIRTIAVDMQRAISPLADFRSLVRLIKVLRVERPDMVHSVTPKAGLLAMLAARITGVPVRIHTFTGLLFPTAGGLRRRLLMFTDWLTCKCATHIIPEGNGVKNDLYAAGITHRPMTVLGNGNVRGIDLGYYARLPEVLSESKQIRDRLSFPPDAFVFIFVGRVVADKGMRELISAFEKITLYDPSVRLLIVGGYDSGRDPVDGDTSRKIEALRSGGYLSLVEWTDDVRPWYAAADALVFPSYREGFPNVVIEAGAMGLPSIVTDINGSREIIIHNENGVIVPPRDAGALYDAMKSFVDSPDFVRSLSGRSRQLVASRYEQGYVRNCLKEFYRKCCHDIDTDIS